jgi:hypothetical protein
LLLLAYSQMSTCSQQCLSTALDTSAGAAPSATATTTAATAAPAAALCAQLLLYDSKLARISRYNEISLERDKVAVTTVVWAGKTL